MTNPNKEGEGGVGTVGVGRDGHEEHDGKLERVHDAAGAPRRWGSERGKTTGPEIELLRCCGHSEFVKEVRRLCGYRKGTLR